ncbi:hypothetical protein CARUB_v10015753mg [Capsella rubella]|uniref:EF-hand domain-containing protein n=1 Tax=Capsella rubella TaxID=81985 RepID=R0G9Y0_9BRAS|nr:hypothetical protein CARUB_v10015753mg [Capsella rubella]
MNCCCVNSEKNKKYAELDAKLARKMVESRRIYPGHRSLKSMDSIIMKFPKLREGLRNIRSVFESYAFIKIPLVFLFNILVLRIFSDNDKNGTIDIEELKKCLEELKLSLSDEEVKGLYGCAEEMDWGRKGKVGFREFLFAFMSWVGLDDADDYYTSS